jgi:hypothetical protein
MAAVALFFFLISPAEALWSQEFNESGYGQFDFMRIDLISGPEFAEPAFSGFSSAGLGGVAIDPSGWSQLWNDGRSAAAGGTEVDTLNFLIEFGGETSEPFAFYFTSYDIDVASGTAKLQDSAKAVWDGGWTITVMTADTWNPGTDSPANPVPEPATLLLLGTGLVGLAGFRARRVRRQ